MSKGKQFKETRTKLIELSNVAKGIRQKELNGYLLISTSTFC